MQANDFSQLLENLASSELDAHRYRNGDSVVDLTYGELIAEADRLARGMHRLGARRGDRVGLVLHRAQDFIPAFLACIRAGFIAVPLYPPLSLGQLPSWAETTRRMLATARASLLLADPPVAYTLRALPDEVSSLREVVSLAELPEGGELPFGPVSDDQVVFLQFTSGSTSAPRGVRVTHGSLWANAHAIMVDGLRASSEDRGVSWLPLYHDMGLIGFVMSPLVTHTPVTFLSTLDFLKDPEIWVRTMSEDRGTISFAPNFGYALTARRTRSTDGLDLSALRVLGCGAEPSQHAAIKSFFERFREAGPKLRWQLRSRGWRTSLRWTTSNSKPSCARMMSHESMGTSAAFRWCRADARCRVIEFRYSVNPASHFQNVKSVRSSSKDPA
jgi:fatty-acyl-CoA synthase